MKTASKQKGVALLEAVIALLILAIGILGLVGVQTKMLVETRTTNSRASAIRLISDLNERVAVNLGGGRVTTNAGLAAAYNTDFNTKADSYKNDGQRCTVGTACTAVQRANSDLFHWKSALESSLMGGQAQITPVAGVAGATARQLRIIVAWKLQEGVDADGNERQLDESMKIKLGTTDACPDGKLCHIQYIELPTF